MQLPQSAPLPVQSSVGAAPAATTTAATAAKAESAAVQSTSLPPVVLGPSVGFWGLAAQCRLVGCRVRVRALRKAERQRCTNRCSFYITLESPDFRAVRTARGSACVLTKTTTKSRTRYQTNITERPERKTPAVEGILHFVYLDGCVECNLTII